MAETTRFGKCYGGVSEGRGSMHYGGRVGEVDGAERDEGTAAPLGSNEPGNEGQEPQRSPLSLGFILSPQTATMASSLLHQHSSTCATR